MREITEWDKLGSIYHLHIVQCALSIIVSRAARPYFQHTRVIIYGNQYNVLRSAESCSRIPLRGNWNSWLSDEYYYLIRLIRNSTINPKRSLFAVRRGEKKNCETFSFTRDSLRSSASIIYRKQSILSANNARRKTYLIFFLSNLMSARATKLLRSFEKINALREKQKRRNNILKRSFAPHTYIERNRDGIA